MPVEYEDLDLLLSRLFHDLIGPVSASRNGLELVREFGGEDVATEAMDLVGQSVDQVAARLTFFRLAFGGAGSAAGHGVSETSQVVSEYLASRRIEWSVEDSGDQTVPVRGFVKVYLGVVAVAAECLPHLGTVRSRVEGDHVLVTAEGNGAGLEASARTAFADGKAADERTVIPAIVRRNAERFGIPLKLEDAEAPSFLIVREPG